MMMKPSIPPSKFLLQLTMAKHKNDIMGMMVMESGYGSAIPACVVLHLSKTGSATKSGLLNVGDHILSINGINLVGMPRKACLEQIKVGVSRPTVLSSNFSNMSPLYCHLILVTCCM